MADPARSDQSRAVLHEERALLRRMRAVSWLEGATLLLLLGVAVPLKHLAGYPGLVRVAGPIHGVAFLLYVWLLVQTLSLGSWSRADTLRMAFAALLPFGAFVNERTLARREAALAGASQEAQPCSTSC